MISMIARLIQGSAIAGTAAVIRRTERSGVLPTRWILPISARGRRWPACRTLLHRSAGPSARGCPRPGGRGLAATPARPRRESRA